MSYSQILRRINRILKSQVEDVWDHLTKEKADLAAFDAELEGKKKTQSSDSAREADSRRAHANTGDAGRGDTHGHAGSGSTSGSTGAGSAGGRTAAGSRRTGSTSGGSAGNSPGAGSNRAGSGRDRAGAGSSGAGTGARSDEGRRKP